MRRWYCFVPEADAWFAVEADFANEAAETCILARYPSYSKTINVNVAVILGYGPRPRGKPDQDAKWYWVRIDPPAPECCATEHEWDRPYEVVDGYKENPGCWGAEDGSTHIREVCRHCGWYRDRHVGYVPREHETIEYTEPDTISREWVARRINTVASH